MGLIKSKFKVKKKQQFWNDAAGEEASDDEDAVAYSSEEKYDQEQLAKLEKMMTKNRDEFILNNLLMSIMFFDNDFGERNQAQPPDNSERDKNLMNQHHKSHIKPDAIAEVVNRNVRFKRRHGAKKNTSEPLLPQRMFIIYQNIQIEQTKTIYAELDKYIKADFERTERKGYFKLKCMNEEEARKSSLNSQISTNSIHNVQTDEDYEYETIDDLRTPKPLEIKNSQHKNLPKTIVREVKRKRLVRVNNVDEFETYSDYYLLSSVLMRHFLKFGFREELAKSLGFTEEDLKTTTYTSSGILCCEGGNKALWEIIPAVLISWPETEAHAWFSRADRRTLILPFGRFRWPAKYMLENVIEQNCVLIPRGFHPKKGVNEESPFEWELTFPLAERYLDTRLSHPHIRAYLFLAAIFKTFIEPKTERKGLLLEHIKNLIFWEVERDVINWPAEKLGTKLLKVIQNLTKALGRYTMANYFVRERNLFENIPSGKLYCAQDVLDLVHQCPVMYFLAALRNLEYVREDFYAFPDLELLRNYLDHPGINANQNSPQEKENKAKEENKAKKTDEKKIGKDDVGQAMDSTDSLNFRWTSKGEKVDVTKNCRILTYFIRHFLTIVKDSIRHKAYTQAKFYVKHCFYLEKLLKKSADGNPDSPIFQAEISQYDMEITKKERDSENPPFTPSRASLYRNERNIHDGFAGSNTSLNYGSASDGLAKAQKKFDETPIITDKVDSPLKTPRKTVAFNFDHIVKEQNEETSGRNEAKRVNFVETIAKRENSVEMDESSSLYEIIQTTVNLNEVEARNNDDQSVSTETNETSVTFSVTESNQSSKEATEIDKVNFIESTENNLMDLSESTDDQTEAESSETNIMDFKESANAEASEVEISSSKHEVTTDLIEKGESREVGWIDIQESAKVSFVEERETNILEEFSESKTDKQLEENVVTSKIEANEKPTETDKQLEENVVISKIEVNEKPTERIEASTFGIKLFDFAESSNAIPNNATIEESGPKETSTVITFTSDVNAIKNTQSEESNLTETKETNQQNGSASKANEESSKPIKFVNTQSGFTMTKPKIMKRTNYGKLEPFIADEDNVVLRINNGVVQTRAKTMATEMKKKSKKDRSSAPVVLHLYTNNEVSEI